MALSSYHSIWEAFQHEFNSAQAETQLSAELFNDMFGFPDVNSINIDHLFEHNHLLYSENCNSLFPDFSYQSADYNDLNSTLAPGTIQVSQEFEPYHCQKCQKVADNYEHELIYTELKPSWLQDNHFQPEVLITPLPDFPTLLPVYNSGSRESMIKPATGGSLSAQSIAAKQRRRKITEKTRELGKLIPGGHKMNTAEMFQAAYKYIKYLQAQVGVLEFIDSSYHKALVNYSSAQENGDSFQSEDLHGLLESPLIQEKLYSTEKCLVPLKFVQALATDHQILESKPHVLDEVRQLGKHRSMTLTK